MNKLSFRSRPLERPMPIYISEELPDLPEYSAINRAVPLMPSGMNKEEESEHHLQRAIVTGLIIPTPEVHIAAYNRLYEPNYKVPRQLIHMQPFNMEQDIPDYDMDSEDEKWLAVQCKTMDIDELKFEEMMDQLEKNSGHSVVTEMEAKVLLSEDDDLIIAVYDYWLHKRLRLQQSLIPTVKTEVHGIANSNNNPYAAFHRRTKKMQTRKNRKNDESTYKKMVKLKHDLTRALTLLELVKRREVTKREMLHVTVDIYEQRYQIQDFSGTILGEASAIKTSSRPVFAPLFSNQFNHGTSCTKPAKDEYIPRKEKRQYKKRKDKSITTNLIFNDVPGLMSSGDDDGTPSPTQEETQFSFRGKSQCSYHAPLTTGLGNWPWCNRQEGGGEDSRFRFNLTSISAPLPRCIGLARRRVGRGGRVILDRAGPSMDDFWASLDFTIHESSEQAAGGVDKRMTDKKPVLKRSVLENNHPLLPIENATSKVLISPYGSYQNWPHFCPKPPTKSDLEEDDVLELLNTNNVSVILEDLNDPSSDPFTVQLNLNELLPIVSCTRGC